MRNGTAEFCAPFPQRVRSRAISDIFADETRFSRLKLVHLIRSLLCGGLLSFAVAWPMEASASATSGFSLAPSVGHGTLVALGDSITYGYNLGNNKHPSPKAFPYLIGKQLNLHVSDLGVPGWTSAQLLHAVKDNSSMRDSIQSAKMITVDIGSNDLLRTAFKNEQTLNQSIDVARMKPKLLLSVATMKRHVNKILSQIHRLNASAVVVVYNLYDPISPKEQTLHALAEYTIQAANLAIAQAAVAHKDPVADAYDALHQYSVDVLAGGVHPTVTGQKLLATQGETAVTIQKIDQFLQSPSAQSRISSWLDNPTF